MLCYTAMLYYAAGEHLSSYGRSLVELPQSFLVAVVTIAALRYDVLCCAVLCCAVLCYDVLCYAMLC